MKDKILIFVIGLLVGAIIALSGVLIYEKINKNTDQIPNGERMQMMERPDGQTLKEFQKNRENDNNRPEIPSKNDFSTNKKAN